MLKYDTVHSRYNGDVSSKGESLIVDGTTIKVFSEKDPANIKWGSAGCKVIVESTGVFTSLATAQAHINSGAEKVGC